tara:strand:- start:1235 stop:1465 length:231 start_codon:yes stop_codon:yes gene_type:complete
MSDQGYLRPRVAFTKGLAEFDAGKGPTNINVQSKFREGKFQKPDVKLTQQLTPNLKAYAQDVGGEKKIGLSYFRKF